LTAVDDKIDVVFFESKVLFSRLSSMTARAANAITARLIDGRSGDGQQRLQTR
jgi:hypothetical protein